MPKAYISFPIRLVSAGMVADEVSVVFVMCEFRAIIPPNGRSPTNSLLKIALLIGAHRIWTHLLNYLGNPMWYDTTASFLSEETAFYIVVHRICAHLLPFITFN